MNFPYQIRLMEILPERRAPLWYFNDWNWFGSSCASFLAEIEIWKRDTNKKSLKTNEDILSFFLENGLENNESGKLWFLNDGDDSASPFVDSFFLIPHQKH